MEDEITTQVNQERYEAVEVPASYSPAIKDAKTESLLRDQDILVLILNKLDKILKSVG